LGYRIEFGVCARACEGYYVPEKSTNEPWCYSESYCTDLGTISP